MRRVAEGQIPSSCFNRAKYREPVFILLGRDPLMEQERAAGVDWDA